MGLGCNVHDMWPKLARNIVAILPVSIRTRPDHFWRSSRRYCRYGTDLGCLTDSRVQSPAKMPNLMGNIRALYSEQILVVGLLDGFPRDLTRPSE